MYLGVQITRNALNWTLAHCNWVCNYLTCTPNTCASWDLHVPQSRVVELEGGWNKNREDFILLKIWHWFHFFLNETGGKCSPAKDKQWQSELEYQYARVWETSRTSQRGKPAMEPAPCWVIILSGAYRQGHAWRKTCMGKERKSGTVHKKEI